MPPYPYFTEKGVPEGRFAGRKWGRMKKSFKILPLWHSVLRRYCRKK